MASPGCLKWWIPAAQSLKQRRHISTAALSAAYGKDFEIPSFTVISVPENELQQFIGTYATKEMPMKINIFVKDKVLMAQATGQGAFPLEATSKTSFKFDTAGIVIDFNPAKKEFILSQGGNKIIFVKE